MQTLWEIPVDKYNNQVQKLAGGEEMPKEYKDQKSENKKK